VSEPEEPGEREHDVRQRGPQRDGDERERRTPPFAGPPQLAAEPLDVGQESELAGALDGTRELPLVSGAHA